MKKGVLILGLAILFLSGIARSQDKDFGLGIILGEPTGISAKKWLSDNSALDGAVAWSLVTPSSFHLHADYLYHDFNIFNVKKGKLPLYFGIGFRVRIREGDNRLGIRIPVGICYIFDQSPLDIFYELGPVLDLTPATKLRLTSSIGIRYFF
jgi:hypothetical protein